MNGPFRAESPRRTPIYQAFGLVYRGSKIPELNGMYLYADYVSTNVWGLRYDEKKGRMTGNHPLNMPGKALGKSGVAVMSFGEDEKGEAYFLALTGNGRAMYRFVKSAK